MHFRNDEISMFCSNFLIHLRQLSSDLHSNRIGTGIPAWVGSIGIEYMYDFNVVAEISMD